MDQDNQHVQLLSVFHYVLGGITALFACFPFIHLAVGIAVVSGAFPDQPGQHGFPVFFGWIFIAVASVLILLGWTLAVSVLVVGRSLARRTHYLYYFVVAAIECVFIPLGTVLGVFTIIVLSRNSVKALFESESASPV